MWALKGDPTRKASKLVCARYAFEEDVWAHKSWCAVLKTITSQYVHALLLFFLLSMYPTEARHGGVCIRDYADSGWRPKGEPAPQLSLRKSISFQKQKVQVEKVTGHWCGLHLGEHFRSLTEEPEKNLQEWCPPLTLLATKSGWSIFWCGEIRKRNISPHVMKIIYNILKNWKKSTTPLFNNC